MRNIHLWCLVCFLVMLATEPALSQKAAAPVVVVPAVEKTVAPRRQFVGTVFPLRSASVGSAVDGRVEKFPVNEGDRVKKGDVLAVLRTAIIKAELEAAKGELRTREAELLELENGSLPEEIEQAQAKVDGIEALQSFHKTELQRIREAGVGASAKELDQALSNTLQSAATLREAKAVLKLLNDGPRPEKIAQAKARVESQKATVQQLQEQLDRHTIYAPFNGYVVAEHTEVGSWLKKGDIIVEVAQLDKVDVEVALLEDYIAYVRVGDEATVQVGAFPKKDFPAKVASVVPRANLRSRTFPVKVRVQNPMVEKQVQLKAGMFARVLLPVGNKQKAMLVPRDAVVIGGPQRILYVVNKNNTVRSVPVEMGFAYGDLVQVFGKLKEGELVVVQGNIRLRPGQKVSIVKR